MQDCKGKGGAYWLKMVFTELICINFYAVFFDLLGVYRLRDKSL
jgi:hypothetical protein